MNIHVISMFSNINFEDDLILFNFYPERDAFDALFENAPEKLNVVKKVWM